MGMLFVIHYDHTPDSRIFLCKTCRTHIAVLQVSEARTILSFLWGVNIVVDTTEHHYKDDSYGFDMKVADVHCVRCNMLLGKKVIQMESPHDRLREGMVVLKLKKLLYWNGQQILDAVTRPPPLEDA